MYMHFKILCLAQFFVSCYCVYEIGTDVTRNLSVDIDAINISIYVVD